MFLCEFAELTTDRPATSLPASPVMPCTIVNIHVDADRDGVIDDLPGGPIWTKGVAGRGAIICVNCDMDERKRNASAFDNRDISDGVINGAADLREIAPLDLRKRSDLPLNGVRVVLSVDTAPLQFRYYIRIFNARTPGATEIIGPNTGAEKTFSDADFSNGRIELGMEALWFPSKNLGSGTVDFDGTIKLNLRVEATDGSVIHSETVPVRVAPWIVFNHTNVTEKVYVARISNVDPNDNDRHFINALSGIVGGKLEIVPATDVEGDRWGQDIMEVGFSNWPGDRSLVSAIRTPNLREHGADMFGQYPGRVLLGPDFGYYETNVPRANSSLDSFGNLECSPPIPGYPFGRVVYGTPGSRRIHPPMMIEMRSHLEGQNIQSPIHLDTGWLYVGHVDEFMSFIPDASGTHGFKIAFASPSRAVDIVRAHPGASLFQGIRRNDGSLYPISVSGARYASLSTASAILADPGFLTLQTDIQAILDSQKAVLKRELALSDSDFIDLPVLFWSESPATLEYCIAFTPGSVNMLVVTNSATSIDLVIPKPFGPMVGGSCKFEEAITAGFSGNSALNLHFVDCFLTYHVLGGEIHCATNSKRVPPTTKWWH